MPPISTQKNPVFIVSPSGVTEMLAFLQDEDYNHRVKELAYKQLADKYGIDREQANNLCQQEA